MLIKHMHYTWSNAEHSLGAWSNLCPSCISYNMSIQAQTSSIRGSLQTVELLALMNLLQVVLREYT